jgi:2-polyprenylphenol 6-hydroxylase
MKHHDIIIIGDGIVGLTLAHALAQQEIDTALILKTPLSQSQSQSQDPLRTYDPRVSAITAASEHLFRHLKVWDDIQNRRVSPFRDMRITDTSGSASLHFDSAWIGQPQLGHIIENSVMLAALQENIQTYPHLTCYSDVSLKTLLPTGDGIILKTHSTPFFTPLLIGADGAHSWVRQQSGQQWAEQPYEQTAIIATVHTTHPHQETAYQRFFEDSVLAFLPLNHPQDHSIVWSCDQVLAEEILSLDDAAFADKLTACMPNELGAVLSCTARLHFPLVMRHADTYVQPHLALIGDAAHTIHPLAGQGLNLGLADVAALVAVIQKNIRLQRPLSDRVLLTQYQRERRVANMLMIKIMSSLKRLFMTDEHTLGLIRQQGMKMTDKLPWLKKCFMHYGMGLYSQSSLFRDE